MGGTAHGEAFTLRAHQLALRRLREQPNALNDALAVLDRWRAQRGVSASDAYMERWAGLLAAGPQAVEEAVCCGGDAAATLRNTSPLGFLLTPAERLALWREAAEA